MTLLFRRVACKIILKVEESRRAADLGRHFPFRAPPHLDVVDATLQNHDEQGT